MAILMLSNMWKKAKVGFLFNGLFLSIHYGPDFLHWGYNLKQLSLSGSGAEGQSASHPRGKLLREKYKWAEF